MYERVLESLQTILANWQAMQSGTMDDPDTNADNAELFETNFYRFIQQFRAWFEELPNKPATLDDALELEQIDHIVQMLPSPLYLPFETELDIIVEGKLRTSDEKYD